MEYVILYMVIDLIFKIYIIYKINNLKTIQTKEKEEKLLTWRDAILFLIKKQWKY